MYCPKCSAVLEEDPRGWLRCSSGQLEFSIDLSRKLRATYGAAAAGAMTRPDFSGHGFYCPGCGKTIPKDDKDWTCSVCGVSLRPVIWPIVELHPHGDGAGGWL